MAGRVMFYVQHLLGIGHVKRAAAIARGLSDAGLDVTVLLGGFPSHLADFGTAKCVQLPPARAADSQFSAIVDEHGHPIDSKWEQKRMCMLLEHYDTLRPDLILVEHFPFGRRKFRFELIPLFQHAAGRSVVTSSVRDVLVEKTNPQRTSKITALVRQWFDAVFVHGDPGFIGFNETFAGTDEIADLIHYTGYVTDHDAGQHPSASGNEIDAGTGCVVVSAGGGAVGGPLLNAAIDAQPLSQARDRPWYLLTGGNLPGSEFDDLKRRAPDNVCVARSRSDFPQLLRTAALSISQGGYNTVMDVLAARCRAIVVPFADGGESEQAFRARRLAEAGLINVLDANALTGATLSAAMRSALAGDPPPSGIGGIDLSGTVKTAQLAKALIRRHKEQES